MDNKGVGTEDLSAVLKRARCVWLGYGIGYIVGILLLFLLAPLFVD